MIERSHSRAAVSVTGREPEPDGGGAERSDKSLPNHAHRRLIGDEYYEFVDEMHAERSLSAPHF